MDNKGFDKIIQNKIAGYEDPTFDPAALTGFHNLMAGQVQVPWYVQYRGTLLTSSALVIFTLLNFWILTNFRQDEFANLTGEIESLKIDRQDYQDLQAEVKSFLKATPAADTVYIIREIAYVRNESLLADNSGATRPGLTFDRSQQPASNSLVYLGKEQEIPPDAKDFLNTHFILLEDADQNIYLIPIEAPSHIGRKGTGHYADSEHPYPLVVIHAAQEDDLQEEPVAEPRQLSSKTIRELDKHARKGVGYRIGGEVQLFKPLIPDSESDILPGGGILGEIMFSPSLSLEVGAKTYNRAYEIDNSDGQQDLNDFPGTNPQIGNLTNIEVDSWILELPINLKYYHLLSDKKDLVLSLGYSPNFYLSQNFEYDYEADLSALPVNPGQVILTDTYKENGSKFYAGTLNSSVSMSWDLPKHRTFQTGLFYQAGLTEMGVERRKVHVVGLKSSYWFRLR